VLLIWEVMVVLIWEDMVVAMDTVVAMLKAVAMDTVVAMLKAVAMDMGSSSTGSMESMESLVSTRIMVCSEEESSRSGSKLRLLV
jgi:hypothetical protein